MPVQQEPIQSQAVLVNAERLPLTILFRTTSSNLNIVQEHVQGKGDVQESMSEDPPHHLFHRLIKPIFSEIIEQIIPFRKVVREIATVKELIQTMVPREVSNIGASDSHVPYGHFNGQASITYPTKVRAQSKLRSTRNYPKKLKRFSKPALNQSIEMLNSTVINTDNKIFS